jgi:hypothetical protein
MGDFHEPADVVRNAVEAEGQIQKYIFLVTLVVVVVVIVVVVVVDDDVGRFGEGL